MQYRVMSLFLLAGLLSCGGGGNNGGVIPDGVVYAGFEYSSTSDLSQDQILRHWAPQVYQDTRNDTVMGHTYYESADMIVRVDYDGDWDAGNNWDNLPPNGGDYSSLTACAYSSFVETETHYFLGYGYFHAADDAIIPMDRHENDYEDAFLCIRKGTAPGDFGTFEAIYMNHHGNRHLYTPSDVTFTGSHVRVFMSSNGDVIGGMNLLNFGEHGHGMEAYVPGNHKVEDDGVVYNVGDLGEVPLLTGDGAFTHHYDYELIDMAELWNRRHIHDNNPFMSYSTFGATGEEPGAHSSFYHALFYNPAAYFSENASFLLSQGPWSFTYLHNPYVKDADPVSALPEGWSRTKLGPVTQSGEAYAWRDLFTLDGSGESKDLSEDHSDLLTVSTSGDMELTARILQLQRNVSSDAFGGIVIRSSLDPGAATIFLGLTPNRKVTCRYRSTEGGDLVSTEGTTEEKPVWVKLVRQGNLFTAFSSADGIDWFQEFTPVEIPMSGSLEVGLFATSNNRDFLAAALFDQVEISSP